jgi:hypothetical protein
MQAGGCAREDTRLLVERRSVIDRTMLVWG